MNTYVLLGAWLIVLVALCVVSAMRMSWGRREDEHLHVSDTDARQVTTQMTIAHKLDVLDHWKTALIVLTVILGLVIAGLQVYKAWQTGPPLT